MDMDMDSGHANTFHQNMNSYPNQPRPSPHLTPAAAVAVAALNQISADNLDQAPMVRRPQQHPVDGPFKHRMGRNQVPGGHLFDAETIDGDSLAVSSLGNVAEKQNNGKKHKKNMRRARAEKSKNAIKSSPAVQDEQKLVAESISEVPQQTETQHKCEENKAVIEDSGVKAVGAGGDGNQVEAERQEDTGHGEGPAVEMKLNANQSETQQNCVENKPMIEDSVVKAVEGGGDGNQVDSEQQKDTGHSEDPAAVIKLNADQPANRRGLRKRKYRTEPSIPEGVIPLVCELCNVKCVRQDTFDFHLAGRKHIKKVGETIDGDGGPSTPEAMLPGNSSAASLSGKVAAKPKPKPWCELCKVECSSMVILVKEHNNGKKHKRNVLKAEKSKNAIKSSPAVQGEQKLVAESISEVPQQTETQQKCVGNKPIIEDSGVKAVEAGCDINQVESEQQKDTVHSEDPAAEVKLNADQTETQQNCEENKPMIEDSGVKAVEAGRDGNQVESEQRKDTGHSEDTAAEIKLNADKPDNRNGRRKRRRQT